MVEKSLVSRQEAKTRELESRLEFERTQVKRLEVSRKHGLIMQAAAFWHLETPSPFQARPRSSLRSTP